MKTPILVGALAAVLMGGGVLAVVVSQSNGPDTPAATSPPTPSSSVAGDPTAPASGAALTEAEQTALKVFTTWSDHSSTYEEWWARLEPLLSPAGKALYQYTDPANIPAITVTGDPEVTDAVTGPNAVTPGGANVAVPTSAGDFIVQLEHDHGDWLMYAMTFPQGVQ